MGMEGGRGRRNVTRACRLETRERERERGVKKEGNVFANRAGEPQNHVKVGENVFAKESDV